MLASFAEALVLACPYDEARAASEEAVAVARQLGADLELGRALLASGRGPGGLRAFEAAVVSLREACRLAEQHADLDTLGRAYGWLAEALMQAGRLEDAVELLAVGSRAAAAPRTGGAVAGHLPAGQRGRGAIQARPLGRGPRAGDTGVGQGRNQTTCTLFSMVATLEIGRGEFEAAEAHLETIKERSLSPGGVPGAREYAGLLAELRVWQGRLGEARAAVEEGLDRVAETDERLRSGRLLCLGMRVEADRAELGRPGTIRGKSKQPSAPPTPLASRAAAMAPNPLVAGASPVLATPAVAALFEGERSRLEGRPTRPSGRWQPRRGGAWPTLPGRLRPMAAGRGAAGQRGAPRPGRRALRAAHAVAVRLGAAPLRRELELLAQRGRIALEAPADPAVAEPEAPSVAASLGLTRREAEVLALVAAGRTNRQIGQELFITPKTAGVHVSRILAKLGVAGRGEAAAVAHRLGLDRR